MKAKENHKMLKQAYTNKKRDERDVKNCQKCRNVNLKCIHLCVVYI